MTPYFSDEIAIDWFKTSLSPSVKFSLTQLDEGLCFRASRAAAGLALPESESGKFYPELWKSDVAELFLTPNTRSSYLEINLAPNGAWWMCSFEGVRIAHPEQPSFEGVVASGRCTANSWESEIFIPKKLLPPPQSCHFNITFILNSPKQTFHSLANLPGEQPDFHQPESFLPLAASLPS